MADKKPSIGAIWAKKTKLGKEFFSITIEGKKYVAWFNEYKSGNQPDYRIFVDDFEPNRTTATVRPMTQQAEESDDQELPF